ncbi:MAG: hypothetical protein C4K49_09435 [Candidatus Thorarchaeota archaeon]|nr:MAG: hypothetical protein C4K49_09435 [Candidatus Thorarchaeota archaeon]
MVESFMGWENGANRGGSSVLSLSGPLRQRKSYLKLVLRPRGITLEDVRNKYVSEVTSFYEFVWDTPTGDPLIEALRSVLQTRMPDLSFFVVMSSLRTQAVTSQRGPKTASHRYRHIAEVEVTKTV